MFVTHQKHAKKSYCRGFAARRRKAPRCTVVERGEGGGRRRRHRGGDDSGTALLDRFFVAHGLVPPHELGLGLEPVDEWRGRSQQATRARERVEVTVRDAEQVVEREFGLDNVTA